VTDALGEVLPNAHRFVSLSDGVTHFRRDGESPAVLLFHGATVPSWEFDRSVPHLTTQGYACCRYDLFGHGYSDRLAKAHDHRLFLNQARDFVSAAQLPAWFAVFGHPLGSIIAARLALDMPARITRLVMAARMLEFQKRGLASALPKLSLLGPLLMQAGRCLCSGVDGSNDTRR